MTLQGESKARCDVFNQLWRSAPVPILYIKGTRDNDWATFQSCINTLERDAKPVTHLRKVHIVEGGGHNPFKGHVKRSGSDCLPVWVHHNQAAYCAIDEFVRYCAS